MGWTGMVAVVTAVAAVTVTTVVIVNVYWVGWQHGAICKHRKRGPRSSGGHHHDRIPVVNENACNFGVP